MSIEGSVGGLGIKFPIFIKAFLAVVGVLFGFVLGGDIDENGKLDMNLHTFIKFSFGVSVSLTGAPVLMHVMKWHDLSESEEGFIFLMTAVFGLLIIGIFYRAVEMYRGKSFGQIINEIRRVMAVLAGLPVEKKNKDKPSE